MTLSTIAGGGRPPASTPRVARHKPGVALHINASIAATLPLNFGYSLVRRLLMLPGPTRAFMVRTREARPGTGSARCPTKH